jgi:peroxiredoxin
MIHSTLFALLLASAALGQEARPLPPKPIGLTPAAPAAPAVNAPSNQKSRPSFSPSFLSHWHGDTLPDAPLVTMTGGETTFAALAGKPTLIALVTPNLLTSTDAPAMVALSEWKKRYASYGVEVIAIANWAGKDKFLEVAKQHGTTWPVAVYADPLGSFDGDANDSYAVLQHNAQTFLGRMAKGGMTPALPACLAMDAQRKVLGSFWFDLRQKDGGAVTAHEGIANLLLKAGVQLSEADRPKEVAAPDAWLKPKPKAAEAAVTALETGKTAPDFSLQTLDGKTVKLSDYKGKVVVLDFWATWCGPCRAALPHHEQLAKTYKDQDVVVLAACTNDAAEAFETFMEEDAFKYPSLLFANDLAGRSEARVSRALYGVSGIPHTFIIGKDGKVAAQVVGYATGEVLIEAALAKAGVKVSPETLTRAAEDQAKRDKRAQSAK